MSSDAQELTKSVLLRLQDQYEDSNPELTVPEMLSSFRPSPNEVILRTSLSLVCQAGLVKSRIVQGQSRYSISSKGRAAVTRYFTVHDNGLERSYHENPAGFDIFEVSKRPDVDWQVVGSVLTGLGIIVTIILWWFS